MVSDSREKTLEESKAQRFFEVTECVMSLTMSALVGVCSLMSLWRKEEVESCSWFEMGREIMLLYLIAHLMYCMWHQGFSGNARVWIAHHLVSIAAVSIVGLHPLQNLLVVNLATLFMEVSN